MNMLHLQKLCKEMTSHLKRNKCFKNKPLTCQATGKVALINGGDIYVRMERT